eukprot:CAMPEP_0170134290 /NCGR_PEP_ID=MMETSP0033_2-20121228/1806_1 /TAXON_ID=195969 /ORGANISM="Dolichomastix tenuilepis, Strain CCMP3274" /LENGTH=795 /DNA_ID=CAMNT_0010369837 /DNA_START=104 /DNA_END=2491 /DNA_ORIENTATION=-
MARGEEDDGLCGDGLRQQVARLRGSKNCVAAETCRRLADVLTYSDAAPAVAAEALAEACACLRRTVDASEGDAEGSVSEDAERLQSEAATLVTRLAEGSPARAEEALAAGGVSACVEALRGCVRRGRAGDPLAAKLALALAVLVAQSVDCRESASAEGVWHAVVPLLALSSAGSAEAALGSRETESWETPSSWGRTVCAEAPRLAGALLAGDASSDIASACLEAGGLGALAVLVLRGEVSACREALRALDSLTSARAPHNQRSRDSLRHGGVLAAAVSRAFAPRSGLVAHGLSLLANLALGNSVNKDAIVAAGALAPAVACLRDGAGGGAFAGTAGESEAARRALAAAKLLAALCQNSRDTAHAAREHGVVVACVRALTVLAMSELALAQASVSAAGGMPPAVPTAEAACRTLASVATLGGASAGEMCRATGAVEALSAILHRAAPIAALAPLTLAATNALGALASVHPACQDAARDANVIRLLVSIAAPSAGEGGGSPTTSDNNNNNSASSPRAKEAAQALRKLVRYNSANAAAMEAEGEAAKRLLAAIAPPTPTPAATPRAAAAQAEPPQTPRSGGSFFSRLFSSSTSSSSARQPSPQTEPEASTTGAAAERETAELERVLALSVQEQHAPELDEAIRRSLEECSDEDKALLEALRASEEEAKREQERLLAEAAAALGPATPDADAAESHPKAHPPTVAPAPAPAPKVDLDALPSPAARKPTLAPIRTKPLSPHNAQTPKSPSVHAAAKGPPTPTAGALASRAAPAELANLDAASLIFGGVPGSNNPLFSPSK